ncbi:hypothetical protein LJE86_12210 [bacterium BMS3Abin03]|nr:hypothetical protein [bacterium BMS3Abin03]
MKKYHDIINYGSIVLIAILLALVIFKLVPTEWYFTFLIVSLFLLVIRIVFRVLYIYQNKKLKQGG